MTRVLLKERRLVNGAINLSGRATRLCISSIPIRGPETHTDEKKCFWNSLLWRIFEVWTELPKVGSHLLGWIKGSVRVKYNISVPLLSVLPDYSSPFSFLY